MSKNVDIPAKQQRQRIISVLADRYKYFIKYFQKDKMAVIGVRQKDGSRVYGEILYSPVDPTNVGAKRTYSSDVMESLIQNTPEDERYIKLTQEAQDAISDINQMGREEIQKHFRPKLEN